MANVKLTTAEKSLTDSGPDCYCGHSRPDHVGMIMDGPLVGAGFFDGPCQVPHCWRCGPTGYLPGDGQTYADVSPFVL